MDKVKKKLCPLTSVMLAVLSFVYCLKCRSWFGSTWSSSALHRQI